MFHQRHIISTFPPLITFFCFDPYASFYHQEFYHKIFGELIKTNEKTTTTEGQNAIASAIRESYKQCDKKIVEFTEREGDKSGATSVTVFIEDNEYSYLITFLFISHAVIIPLKLH